MPWFDYLTAIEGLAEEKPWAPQPVALIDGERYEGPLPFDGADELALGPQDVHAGGEPGDDSARLRALGITVVDG